MLPPGLDRAPVQVSPEPVPFGFIVPPLLCACVPINGIAQSNPIPVRQSRTARVDRAEKEEEEVVFISRCVDSSPATSPLFPFSHWQTSLSSFPKNAADALPRDFCKSAHGSMSAPVTTF